MFACVTTFRDRGDLLEEMPRLFLPRRSNQLLVRIELLLGQISDSVQNMPRLLLGGDDDQVEQYYCRVEDPTIQSTKTNESLTSVIKAQFNQALIYMARAGQKQKQFVRSTQLDQSYILITYYK